MSIFGRKKRQVRHYDPDDPQPDMRGSAQFDTQKKRHKGWKWLGISLLVLVILAAIAALIAYLYIDTTVLRGEKEGRINIMVLGVDDTATLSDTIMIASIDTRRGEEPKVSLISIPRDFYVEIPDFGGQKINFAYSYGEANDYPGGGVAVTAQVLEETMGIPIHYFATMDFTGFKQLIDTVGGVNVNIEEDLYDSEYPADDNVGTETFELPAGQYLLDGETALKVARCRKGTCNNDFGRAARQQQILMAFRNELFSRDTFFESRRIEEVRTTLEKHVETDLTLREMAKLGKILRAIPDERITRHVIDSSNLLTSYPAFGSALAPRAGVFVYSEVHEFVKNIFSQTSNTLPEPQQ